MLAQILNPLIGMALVVVMARAMGAEGLGAYTFAISLLTIFEIIGRLGIREYVVREIGRDKPKWPYLFSSGLVLGSVASLVAQIAMLVAAKIIGYEPQVLHGLFIISFALLPTVLYYVFESILYAFDRMAWAGTISVAETIVRVGLSLGALVLDAGLDALLLVFVLSRVVAMILSAWAQKRCAGFPLRQWRSEIFRDMLRVTPTFAMLAILAAVYWRVDVLMLSRLSGNEAVGQYSAGFRLMYLLAFAGSSVLAAVYPTMTRLYHHERESYVLLVEKMAEYLILIYLPVAVAGYHLSPRIMPLLFGAEFDEAIIALRILIWVSLPLALATLFANALVAANRQNLDLRVNVFRLIWIAMLSYFLIRSLGVAGAGIATLGSCIAAVLLQGYYLRDLLHLRRLFDLMMKPSFAAAIMAFILALMNTWPLALQIAIAAAVYLSTLVALRPFNQADRQLLHCLGIRTAGGAA